MSEGHGTRVHQRAPVGRAAITTPRESPLARVEWGLRADNDDGEMRGGARQQGLDLVGSSSFIDTWGRGR